MELKQAQRKQVKIKLGIQGPSGSGKTYSSLLLANGLVNDWSKIAVIDTENSSSHLYSHLGDYKVLSLSAPFTPERYIQAIETCEKASIEVIIIDSISPTWEGAGGILEIHSNMTGNSFTAWQKLTPRFNALIQKILQSSVHVIVTIRSKQDYVLSNKNGKMVPEKVGLKGITRDGFDYEMTIVFDIDIKHFSTVSKDRTGLYVDKPAFLISQATGKRIKNWCSQGISINDITQEINNADSDAELHAIYDKHPDLKKQLYPIIIKRKEVLDNKPVNLNAKT